MANLSIKEQIKQLQLQLKKEREQNDKLTQLLYDLQNKSDDDFTKSPYYLQLHKELDMYKEYKKLYDNLKNKSAKKLDAQAEYIQKLINENEKLKISQINNSRGAGRKSKIDDTTKKNIIHERAEGMTIKELAQKYDCSVGTIHKLINEKQI